MTITTTMTTQLNRLRGITHFAQEISKTGTPEAKFLLGIAALPSSIIIKNLAQGALSLCGFQTISVSDVKNLPMKILNAPLNMQRLLNIGICSCAEPIFYGEFLQNYVLDKKLSSVLAKVAPKHADFTKTKEGRISRVFLCSFLAGMVTLIAQYNLDFELNLINEKYKKADEVVIPVAKYVAHSVNKFIKVFLICALRESTKSNLPGIGLEFINSYS